ncbi:amino acid ABC transporter permease [Paracoccaceae bacterium]|jgi:general L-amino acid transport system permease protein|nr:amino acid ABC transporter permease [Paracoccaceae bacterium]MDC0899814.1 amino acid ABC transporter permease [Paracoccaceae bacterium]
MSNNSNSFVRHEMLEERAPPVGEGGVLKWVRENLFSSVFNTIMTIIAVWVIYSITVGVAPWFLNGVWNAETTRECYEILDGVNGACFAVLQERFPQLIYGFKYPSTEYWRPNLATILLLVALAPVLFRRLPKRLLVFTVIYPFLAYWLIWGGSVLIPTVAFIGCCVGGVCYKRFSSGAFATAIILSLISAYLCWFLGGYLISWNEAFLSLKVVPSRDMGGFMLNLLLGTIAVSLSIPLGIALALGRQSNMPIIKWICVVFIEFIRGVPLITLLFVANVILAFFFPPETSIDLILRVIIMMTFFNSAYIAEVVRGGLAALPSGQYEAANSLGLDYSQSMRFIILPQALKISIPGIVNVSVGMLKDTTLVSIISMFDLVGMIRGPILSSTDWNGVYWELFGAAAAIFFVVCFTVSKYSQWLERQLETGKH